MQLLRAVASAFAGFGSECDSKRDVWKAFYKNWSAGGILEITPATGSSGKRQVWGLKPAGEKRGREGSNSLLQTVP